MKATQKQSFEVARLNAGVVLRTNRPEKAKEEFEAEAAAYHDEKVYLWTWSGHKRIREQVLG